MTNQLYICPETHQPIPLKAQITRLHTWDYAFWLDYLDLQRQALGLKPKFAKLDDQADDHQLKRISYALHHPKFQLYLGRRSNPPEGPLETKIMTDMDPIQALSQLKWQATEEYQKRQHTTKYHTQILADADLAPDKPVQMIKDAIGSLNPAHRFSKYRPTVELQVTLTNQFIEDKPKLKKSNKNNNEILDQTGTNQDPLAAI